MAVGERRIDFRPVGGEATNRPTDAVVGSPVTSLVPTWVQVTPSTDSYPVTMDPVRVSLSHRGAGSREPAAVWEKPDCHCTPCPGVTMTAAYRGSGSPPSFPSGAGTGAVIIRPAFAFGPVTSWSATRATIEPSPVSGWWTSCTEKTRCGPKSFASVVLPDPAR